MSRRHRHHRQHSTPASTSAVHTEVQESEPISTSATVTSQAIRADLQQTALVTAILVALLLLSYYLNAKTGWTLTFGSELYRWLHIR